MSQLLFQSQLLPFPTKHDTHAETRVLKMHPVAHASMPLASFTFISSMSC